MICGLGLPNQKSWVRLWIGDRLKNFFEDLFLENTCGCVLGPWPWPRAFLSLASRGSVLGKAVLGLGLGFFCVLGLEPCVLDSTSDSLFKTHFDWSRDHSDFYKNSSFLVPKRLGLSLDKFVSWGHNFDTLRSSTVARETKWGGH